MILLNFFIDEYCRVFEFFGVYDLLEMMCLTIMLGPFVVYILCRVVKSVIRSSNTSTIIRTVIAFLYTVIEATAVFLGRLIGILIQIIKDSIEKFKK